MAASKKLNEILRDMLDSLTPPDMKFQITYNNSQINLMNSQEVYLHLSMLAGGYRWYYPEIYPYNINIFFAFWTDFLARNTENIGRQYTALLETYNPIYNYDLTEQAADGSRHDTETITTTPSGEQTVTTAHTGTDTSTPSGQMQVTSAHTGTDTTTPSGQMQVTSSHTGTDTTTDSRWGYDSGSASPADKSELAHGETVTDTTTYTNYQTSLSHGETVTDTTTYTGYKEELSHGETVTETTTFDDYKNEQTKGHSNDQTITLPDGTTATGFADGSEHYLRRFGNIGVQTAADILGGELALRVHDLAIEWLQRFVDLYLVYVGDAL